MFSSVFKKTYFKYTFRFRYKSINTKKNYITENILDKTSIIPSDQLLNINTGIEYINNINNYNEYYVIKKNLPIMHKLTALNNSHEKYENYQNYQNNNTLYKKGYIIILKNKNDKNDCWYKLSYTQNNPRHIKYIWNYEVVKIFQTINCIDISSDIENLLKFSSTKKYIKNKSGKYELKWFYIPLEFITKTIISLNKIYSRN